ncbi:MAG TPA: tyrosine-type recombinase/integrase [Chloroflexota bacterium]|jgi:integrase
MSELQHAAEEYLALRRALGFKLESQGPLLLNCVGYLDRAGASTITIELALAWAQLPPSRDPVWYGRRLGVVRGFAKHLQALDPRTEVPPADLLPQRYRRATPYLYSPDDIRKLMAAARGLRSPLRAATYEALVGLLAVTGMRVGEAIRLDRPDLDWEHGLLTIIASKFGKSREVALHPRTCAALAAYAQRRDVLCPQPTAPSFFVSTAGTRLLHANVRFVFGRLVRAADLERRSGGRQPRLHDLRHSFAVATLLTWYRADADVQARLPLLSTYLGHVDPASTYWYLEAAPELLALAAQRLERALEGLP